MTAARALFLLLLCLLAAPVRAAAPPDLLGPGGWVLLAPRPADAALTETADGTLTVTVRRPSVPFYGIQIVRGLPSDVAAGDRVQIRFRARSATHSPLRVTVEKNGPPYDAVAAATVALSAAWQDFTATGTTAGFGPRGLSAHFQMGQQAGVVQIGRVSVTGLGPDPALVAARLALDPARTQARIEKYRKGTLTVRVVGPDGRPARGARVRLTQTRHAFLFGANIFNLDPADPAPAQRAYQSEFTALFNYATLPFYWGAFEPVRGRPEYARLDAMARWCVAHQITPKGHPLIWHEVWPSWAPNDPGLAVPLLRARVSDLVPRFSDTIHYWDVVNEASAGAQSQTPPNGESRWVVGGGPAQAVGAALGWARAAGRGHAETFLYNDYDTGDANLALLTGLQKDGRLPDAVGIQSHMHTGVWPLEKVWAVCQSFSRFNRPIHFTETTVLSGAGRTIEGNGPPVSDWETTPEGEAAQADYVARFYTVLFSHPSVRAITWWDFSDHNSWLGAPAGLVRRDMTPKPAYARLMSLIHGQWWTRLTARADAQGRLTRRVFYGDYTLAVTDAQGHTRTQTLTFPESAPPLSVTVRLR